MSEFNIKKKFKSFKKMDFFVLIFFLITAAISVNLFRLDLLNTINMRKEEPIGTVVIRKNIVQRRLSDRVLWDRLASGSPVYEGDLIRVADMSKAALYIDGNSIDLGENTLIRIIRAPLGKGYQIIMSEGNLSVLSGENNKSISVNIKGRIVEAIAGASIDIFNVIAEKDEIMLKVNEGAVRFINDSIITDVISGEKIIIDTNGETLHVKSAAVIIPVTNARFINSKTEPFNIDFFWNRLNLNDNELLRLEISSDRNFKNIHRVYENLNRQANAILNNGLWYWRLVFQGTILDNGFFSITNGAGASLQSPVFNSVFTYNDKLPAFNFSWARVNEAQSYILEISNSPEFSGEQIQRQSDITFFSADNISLADGIWYWRVKPVFPSVYTGEGSFSNSSCFHIQKRNNVNAETNLQEWLTEQMPYAAINETQNVREMAIAAERALGTPRNLEPARGRRFTTSDLQTQRSINFSWQAVSGANAYLITIYRQSGNRRRQIFISQPLARAGFSLDNLSILDNGTFIWQVEAIKRRADGTIEQRGTAAESVFIMDIALPGRIRTEDVEIIDE